MGPTYVRYGVLAWMCAAATIAYVARNSIGVAEVEIRESLGLQATRYVQVIRLGPWHSFVVDPFGRYISEAGEREEVLIARCDPALIETIRRNWPFLRDRRIDAYGPILNRYLGA